MPCSSWKTSINMKYRSVETFAGPSGTNSTSASPKKKMNPARARRSKARLELFMKKKVEERNATQDLRTQVTQESETSEVAGVSNHNTSKVVMDMTDKNKDQPRTKEISPIPQLDGVCESESQKKKAKSFFPSRVTLPRRRWRTV